MEIIAQKNGQEKKFSEYSWSLLPADKNGWQIVPEGSQTAKNEVKTPPSTGQKTTTDQVVTNEVNKTANQTAKNEVKTDQNPDEFYELAKENVKREIIKDYLDINEIPYKQNDKHDVLIELLRNKLNGDIELLKKEFSI